MCVCVSIFMYVNLLSYIVKEFQWVSFFLHIQSAGKQLGIEGNIQTISNNSWGRFGQSSELDSREFIYDYSTLLKRCSDPKIQTAAFGIINENFVEFIYTSVKGADVDVEYISEITALFITAHARLRLYKLFSWFCPSQLIYCHTDSVYV